ncbi:MAG TPA: protein-L-isoaspartate(D-aspartate) O-methyltransferase [Gammaproteobacteria bacterium]|nr:protein-L-isoaspartate(D-aspartate) O-methyltransferase [Gammaproteobacteria bacterium]
MSPDRRGIGLTSQRARDRLVARLREMGISDDLVLEMMRSTPRHLFVDEALASRAYENTALPIGYGQTISQPYVVARMTSVMARCQPLARVLEVGAGSGYQTALLARLATHVYCVERVAPLAIQLRRRMANLGYHNVSVRHGDGRLGWSRHAPFDAVLVAAAAVGVPPALVEQLAVGGSLIMPVGHDGGVQHLLFLVKHADGSLREENIESVSFVPLLEGVA